MFCFNYDDLLLDEMYLEDKRYLHHILCYIAVSGNIACWPSFSSLLIDYELSVLSEMTVSAGAIYPPNKRIYRYHFRQLLNDHP